MLLKLWQKPPITTLLVGAGLAALFGRSSVREIDVDPYDPERPSGYVPGGVAGYGYATTRDMIEQKAIGGATFAIETAREKAGELRDRVGEMKDGALRSASELKDEAVRSASELMDNARRSPVSCAERDSLDRASGRLALGYARDARAQIGPARDYAEDVVRDNGVYFGLAALAIGAAAGIGLMQMNKPVEQDESYLEDEKVRVDKSLAAAGRSGTSQPVRSSGPAASRRAGPRRARRARAAARPARPCSHRIVAPDLLLHRRRRAAAVQADHRIPAALVARRSGPR